MSEATSEGDSLATLRALRDLLAASIEQADPEKRAPLSHQLRATLADIKALEKEQPAKKGTVLDELNARRALRGASAPGGTVAEG